jgi:hypothetical protein
VIVLLATYNPLISKYLNGLLLPAMYLGGHDGLVFCLTTYLNRHGLLSLATRSLEGLKIAANSRKPKELDEKLLSAIPLFLRSGGS